MSAPAQTQQARFTVGPIQSQLGPNFANGQGFVVYNSRQQPVFSATYATTEDAETARNAMSQAIEGATHIEAFSKIG